MSLLNTLVEKRIAEAEKRGDFSNLPGKGVAQTFEDDLLVPEEIRMANRILKNAGLTPPAVEQLRERNALQHGLSQTATGDKAKKEQRLRLLTLEMALESLRGSPAVVPAEYQGKLISRLTGKPDEKPEDCASKSKTMIENPLE